MKLGKLVGTGNTADVYEWEEDKVLKLFHQGYPKAAIEKEYNNALVIRDMDFLKPRVYDLVPFKDRWGIVYDKTVGETLLEWVMKTGYIQKCASYMAELHKQIIINNLLMQQPLLPYYKDFLNYNIPDNLPPDKRKEVQLKIDRLEDGNVLCHGDFHPGNIVISGSNAYVIDFMNICRGNRLYDIARTVFLVEYSPIPQEVKDRDMIIKIRRELTDLYLKQMDVEREMLKDYIEVISVIRQGEL